MNVNIEQGIREPVRLLNEAGWITKASCEGHNADIGNMDGTVGTYIALEKDIPVHCRWNYNLANWCEYGPYDIGQRGILRAGTDEGFEFCINVLFCLPSGDPVILTDENIGTALTLARQAIAGWVQHFLAGTNEG